MVLDTEVTDLKDNALWHTDVTFTTAPPMGAVLSAQVLSLIHISRPETNGR